MFKAKLIENTKYYGLRRKQLILMLLPSILIWPVVNFYQTPVWLTILMSVLYIGAILLILKNQKQINSVLGNKLMEVDSEEIRIKSKTGNVEESINLKKVTKIVLKSEYSIPQETIKDVGQELTGKAKQNYIILHQDGQVRTLDFEVDAHYMINQLNKLIENWEVKGYKVERIK